MRNLPKIIEIRYDYHYTNFFFFLCGKLGLQYWIYLSSGMAVSKVFLLVSSIPQDIQWSIKALLLRGNLN